MIDIQKFLSRFSSIILSLVQYFLHRLKKTIHNKIMSTLLSSPTCLYGVTTLPREFTQCTHEETMTAGSLVNLEKKQRNSKHRNDDQSVGEVNCGLVAPCGKPEDSRKRPARLQVPAYFPVSDFGETRKRFESRPVVEVEGRDYFVASKKGRRENMEDGHGVILDILGDPKQAFFMVIDGHGGRGAVDYVSENLGKNIVNQLVETNNHVEDALRQGYEITDNQFLLQGKNGGACAASVLIKDGEIHVANVGDCRVVLSRKNVAVSLTTDHRLTSEDERARIEKSGGFLYCHNGVWRVNGSLAVSRAFGDHSLKKWIISDPHILNLPLSSDSQFLILASDGLWDKVSDQEAVDVVLSEKSSMKSCKKLVDLCSNRGNLDDVTVMIINLPNFFN